MTVRRLWWRKESCSVSGQFIAESTAGGYTTQKDLTLECRHSSDQEQRPGPEKRKVVATILVLGTSVTHDFAGTITQVHSWFA